MALYLTACRLVAREEDQGGHRVRIAPVGSQADARECLTHELAALVLKFL